MSQHKSGNYLYGYDNQMSEYFLMEENDKGDIDMIVGTGSTIKGNKTNLLTEIRNRKIVITKRHKVLISMDLPV